MKSSSRCVSLSLLRANSCIPGAEFSEENTFVFLEAQLGCLEDRRETIDEVRKQMKVDFQSYMFKFRQKLGSNSTVAS